jgi:hypothetical protein
VACPKEQAEEMADFLEEVMVVGRDKVVKPGLDADPSERVPVEVDVEAVDSGGRGIDKSTEDPRPARTQRPRPYPRPLPYASHTASSIPSLVDSQGLRQSSISSTTDSSFVPNHKSPGMVGRSAGGSQRGSPSTVEGARSSPSWRLPPGAL